MDKATEHMGQLEDSPGKAGQQEQSPGDVDKAEALGQPAHSKDELPHSHTLQWETLGRQFVEYEQVAPFLIPEEQQRRLMDFLPLFLKAWEESAGVIVFPNIQLLASEVSKLLTKEIKKNLNGKPAEEARLALEQLLQQKGEVEDGCLLLKSVYLLSQTDVRTLWNIIGSGLPAALMQCLYLFFTFPLKKTSDDGETSENKTQTQEMLVKIMLNMYREEQGVEELLAADKLQSLIIATASLWDQCNRSWKVPTGRVLRTISKAQTRNSILYLQAVDCIKIAIQNLFKLADTLPACDACEAVSIILCFVKDSYPISSVLLTEFENNDGYQLLLKVLLRCEGLQQNEGDPYLNEILDMLTCLTTCGKTELKVSGNIVHPQLPHFDFERTRSSGMTVKNLQAFQVLQSIFQKSNDQHLCGRILGAIGTIWAWNMVNFFLLEWTLQPINKFTDIIHFKPHPVQVQFFRLVESIVLDLSYIPHEILKKVQYLIKENVVPICTLTALRCLLSMTKKDPLFSDIFRDSGLLGLLLALLRKQAKILRKSGTTSVIRDDCTEKELNAVMLKMVAALTLGSVRNTVVLKDYGMVPYIKIFLDDECYRSATLSILEQLSVINYEEYMSIVIGALCSSTQGELNLKLDLLKSLLRILESPKSHSAFRTCSGFNGLLSLLSDMEGALQDPPSGLWAAVGQNRIMELVFYTLQGITAALHLDPVNSDFFQRNSLFEKMAEDLGSLGCFWTQREWQNPLSLEKKRTFAEFLDAAFCSSEPFPAWLKNCIWILNFLDHMVKGTLHLESYFKEIKPEVGEPSRDDQEGPECSQCRWPVMWETRDCVIVHPGAVCVMVRLLPKLYKEGHSQLSQEIQCAVADHIQSLVKSEKSRQVMCGSGLLSTIIASCQDAFRNESHPLHLPLTRVFEKLASQSIEPDVTSPWLSKGSALALQTAMSLISMTSPRNFQLCSTSLAPSFVEFDMSMEGYGCLFLPTLATVMGPGAEQSVSGGIGMGTRMFPPSSGLTLSCWFLVSKFGVVHNSHPVRFLTVVRHMARTEQEFVCFAISFSPQDHSLVISTEEVEFQPLDIMEPEGEVLNPSLFPGQVQFGCGKMLVTGQWHHLTVTVAKEAKKSCIVSAYINGQTLGSAKMRYLQPLPGSYISMESSSFVDVYGYIATPRVWKQKSSLTWRLGPTYLFEEAISVETMEVINKLGPRYCSNFQAVQLQGKDQYSEHNPTLLVAEEKICFGINAMCSSFTTIQDIKNSCNEVDGRLVAKEIGINSRDSSTPIFLAKNIAGHLSGSSRTIGSVAVGQYGVRVFKSSPAATSLNFIGGPSILLGLIAMACDDHTMYAAVKVLNSILNSSPMSEKLMRHMGGYQLLAYLLKRKTQLLNNRILQLMFSLVGTAELGFESSVIKNFSAFQYILCNFELWMKAPENLDLVLFSHLAEILQSSRDGCRNAEVAYQVQMVPKLIFLFNDPEISDSRITVACTILSHQLQGYFNTRDVLRVALFLVYTLKPSSVDENQLCLEGVAETPSEALSQTSGKTIWLRNQLLKMLLDVICSDKTHLSAEAQQETFLALGSDWFLLFTQSYLHSSTVALGMKLLLCFLHNRSLLNKFKEGMVAGRWLENSSTGLNILMDNLKTHPPVTENGPFLIFGFSVLQKCLTDHVHIPEIYLLVARLFLATPHCEPPETGDLDSMLQWILQHHITENVLKTGLCAEAAALLLEMVRVTVDKVNAEASWEINYPGNVIQFLCLVYHSYTQDPVWHCPDFLKTLAMVAFHSGAPKVCVDPRGTSESTASVSVMNVAYFAQKLIEKLSSRMFAADPKQILLFTAKQIVGVLEGTVSQKEVFLNTLYSCLNRAILYCLSRPQQSLPEKFNVLNTLNVLQEQWDIIFATYNSSNNFVVCLMHCLCQLNSCSYPEGFGVDAKPRLASHHQIFLAPSEEEKGLCSLVEILRTVEIIWKQLISQRRQALEDIYKMDLSVKGSDRERDMKITEITPLWEEMMTKAWQNFLASEKRILQNKGGPGSSQSKHNSWSESLSSAIRLMPGRNTKEMTYKSEGFVSCMEQYRRTGQELYASLYKDHVQMLQCGYSKAAKDWMVLEEQLFYRRGPWGIASQSLEQQWILDCFEGPSRMRRRIQHGSTRATMMRMKSEVEKICRRCTNSVTVAGELTLNGAEREMDEKRSDCNQLTFFPALHESFHSEDFLELCVERQVILQEFAECEKVAKMIVQGHTALEGVLLFGKEHFYICECFVLSPLEEVYCTRHCLSSISDPFIFNLCHKDHAVGDQVCSRYLYHDIKEIRLMRFLLQEIALEIFFKNGYSRFLVFHDNDRNKIFKRFCSFQPALKSNGEILMSVSFPWQKREISNFDYLMYLNTLAGRSYNDYMQYPVFPWVLADYHSQTLNLSNPHTFRDLSKPMGAQTTERKQKFIQRYNEVEKSEGDLSAQCHYCTHYSSAIIVASYLVRLEPFTQTFCSLQGGSFDVADRMFHSVKSTWESASRDNMSDVRELIPEFFYLPEFLTNANHFELGCMQDGTVLGDVQLPPWADGDPHKFILLHRQALESDYVSAHLHRWIDLIFGHKQHGSAAVEAVNTYHPYFYGDKMDLNNIKDPLIKSTILGFISNFGQIPKQVSLDYETPPQKLNMFSVLSDYPKGAIGHIVHTEKGILAVEKNKVLIPPLWNKTFCWGFEDFTCCFGNYGSEKNMTTFECMADWGKCLCAVCPSATTIITSGTSSVVCVWELSLVKDKVKHLNLRQALYGHSQAVTCLAVSVTYSIIVSGSDDRTCIIWDLNQLTYITQLPAHGASLCSGDIASCAGSYLCLWTVNGQPLVSINTTCSPESRITCCCFAEVMDWDTRSVVITGSTDGVVRVVILEMPNQMPILPFCGKHLVLCRELNPSLALTGKPSKNSPAVTALAMSRNSSKLLVGDDWGRICCWCVDG
uniref:WDFY family member 4 n=1 Tax=Anser brachyrhynchus TaxID=132585 RepID=A0A8B9C663_9AVES